MVGDLLLLSSLYNNIQQTYANVQLADLRGIQRETADGIAQLIQIQRDEQARLADLKQRRISMVDMQKTLTALEERMDSARNGEVTVHANAFVFAEMCPRQLKKQGVTDEALGDDINDLKFLAALERQVVQCRQQAALALPSEAVRTLDEFVDHCELIPIIDQYCRWRRARALLPEYPKTMALLERVAKWGSVLLMLFFLYAIWAGAKSASQAIVAFVGAMTICGGGGALLVASSRAIGASIRGARWHVVSGRVNHLVRSLGIRFGNAPNPQDIDEMILRTAEALTCWQYPTNRSVEETDRDLTKRQMWFAEVAQHFGFSHSIRDTYADAGFVDERCEPQLIKS